MSDRKEHPGEKPVLSADDVMWTSAITSAVAGLVLMYLVASSTVDFDAALGFLFGTFFSYILICSRAFIREAKLRYSHNRAKEQG